MRRAAAIFAFFIPFVVFGLIVGTQVANDMTARAQNAPLEQADLQAALNEATTTVGILESRAQQLAVELGRAKRALAQAEAAKCKPAEATKP